MVEWKGASTVLPYHPYPGIFDSVVHYGGGRNFADMPLDYQGPRRERAKSAIARAIERHGVKHVLKVLAKAPVINS